MAPTPGPWRVADSYARNPALQLLGKAREIFILAVDLSENSICAVATVAAEDQATQAREMANAHLIAAAPDYHEAALALVARHDAEAKRVNFTSCGCEDCKPFRSAIAKVGLS